MKKFLSFALSLALALTLGVVSVQAATDTLDDLKLENLSNQLDVSAQGPAETLVTIINTLFGLLGTVALLIFLYAGFQWMMSGDSADGAKKAKERMKNAAIGIFLILAAYSISSFVINALTTATGGNG
ncbi:hypothetical protein IT409_02360 [Candidatus Falkowbacteria bacterium]|nr:hypothetical protein [Candidatus Falkowbacteria bacterium]